MQYTKESVAKANKFASDNGMCGGFDTDGDYEISEDVGYRYITKEIINILYEASLLLEEVKVDNERVYMWEVP